MTTPVSSIARTFRIPELFQILCAHVIDNSKTLAIAQEKILALSLVYLQLNEINVKDNPHCKFFPTTKALQYGKLVHFDNYYFLNRRWKYLDDIGIKTTEQLDQFLSHDKKHNLTTLSLPPDQIITEKLTTLQHLKVLNSSCNGNLSNDSLEIIGRIKSLQELILHNSDSFTIEGIRHLFPLKDLSKIDLQYCTGLDSDAIIETVTNFTKLSLLKIAGNMITEASLTEIKSHGRIRELHLTFDRFGDVTELSHLAGAENLNKLVLMSCKTVPDLSLFTTKNFPNLKKLYFLYSAVIQQDYIEQIKRQMPFCKIKLFQS